MALPGQRQWQKPYFRSTTLRATMLFVITNHNIYTKLQAEIDSTVVPGTIISNHQVEALPYLRAVIKEGARMWPPASGLMSKKTPPEGDMINGVFVPGGIDIGQCAWDVQRSKRVYGEDSPVFRPERWLEVKEEQLERMERSLSLIWGYGKYSCLGKNIAWMELNKCLFEVRTFV
ncbi:Cytochrome P450 monooxygenase lolP1 [Hyphodiscus hymeniophilus]|uniref:Cytochrome P450 monooxygenase lolP1 n=1 Tax=Hyphodiscus hymeniophilus TaxID=353542 RepID=A0A9P6VK61_9HELO|nr:Cytochrome P450 monooxygenase lolP1 [Hyphodiscus hymeniophilus]